jgi:hypothetical protein
MKREICRVLRTIYFVAGWSIGATALVQADVTTEQQTSLDVASMIRMHGAITTNITADKKRDDSEMHCEGMMSFICGNLHSGEIVRLDRGLTWRLQPNKKTYREEVFATPEEVSAMRAKMQANLEKMRSCPVSQKQQPIDKSKCEMSPPKVDVHKTDDKMAIAGHDTQRTSATLTETCTNKDTGDVCDTVIALDVWLTQDNLAGAGDRRAFDQAYAKKLGLDDAQGAMREEFAKYLGPYQSQIKQLTDKSKDLKGHPMKTSLRVVMGGKQCGAAKTNDTGSPSGDSSSGTSSSPADEVKQAGKAIGSLVGGLFHKKKTDDAQTPSAATPAPAVANSPDPYAQYAQLATFTLETVTINTDAIPAERFDVPPDWKKEVPKASKKGDDEFTCPKSGS